MATLLIIIANGVIFAMFNMQLVGEQLQYWLVSYGLSVATLHNPLNWFTTGFIHANEAHIVMNMLFLASMGFGIEKRIGTFWFIVVYTLSLIGGSAASVAFIEQVNPYVNVLGASGALFGIFAFDALVSKSVGPFLVEAAIYHAIVYFLQMPIAWFAHAGGAIVGIICGVIAYPFVSRRFLYE